MSTEKLYIKNVGARTPYVIVNNNDGTFTVKSREIRIVIKISSLKQVIDAYNDFREYLNKAVKAFANDKNFDSFKKGDFHKIIKNRSKYHGNDVRVTCIDGKVVYGKIKITEDESYICTNYRELDGSGDSERFGFMFSWYVDDYINNIDILNESIYYPLISKLDMCKAVEDEIVYSPRICDAGLKIGCNIFKIEDVIELYSKLSKDNTQEKLESIYKELEEVESRVIDLKTKVAVLATIKTKTELEVVKHDGPKRDSMGRFVRKG